jgi:hypothetical protein
MGGIFSSYYNLANDSVKTMDKGVTAAGNVFENLDDAINQLVNSLAMIPQYVMTAGKWILIIGGVLLGGVVLVWGVMAVKGDAHKAIGAAAQGVSDVAKVVKKV